MILNTKEFTTPFEEISPQELNKCQVLFVGIEEKVTTAAVRSLRAKLAIVGNSK